MQITSSEVFDFFAFGQSPKDEELSEPISDKKVNDKKCLKIRNGILPMFLRFILVQQLYGRKEVQSASLQVTYKKRKGFFE